MDRGDLQLHEQVRNEPHHDSWATGVQPERPGSARMVGTLIRIALAGMLAFPVLGMSAAMAVGLIPIDARQLPVLLPVFPIMVVLALSLHGAIIILFGIMLALTLVPAAMLGWTGWLHRIALGLGLATAMLPFMPSEPGQDAWRVAVVALIASVSTSLLFPRRWLSHRLDPERHTG